VPKQSHKYIVFTFAHLFFVHYAMRTIFFKELNQFFSNLTGYLAIGVFQLLMGLSLFLFPDASLLTYGYATLDKFFELTPWILLLLAPAVCMRSFADEFKSGTWELLATKPLTTSAIVLGKFLAAWLLCLLALLPAVFYIFTIKSLSINGSIDTGGIAGAMLGLAMLCGLFAAVGTFASASTNNAVVAFLASAFACFLVYQAFDTLSALPALQGGPDYWVAYVGAQSHYSSISRGVVELKDLLYFACTTAVFLVFTRKTLLQKTA
jgi:ABC-2 type transport system permease protein